MIFAGAFLALAATALAAINNATYDGTCYYPTPDPSFPGLEEYMGRWYQVAGTIVPFTLGCSCVFAEYSLNVCSLHEIPYKTVG
jgi:lipocalin